jgi:crossover junction endodeoxyribonuclease RuvC
VLRVLGVDPGTRVVGWGIVDGHGSRAQGVAWGVLRVAADRPIAERLAGLAQGLHAVLARYAPHEAAIEEVFYGRDVRAAVRIGEGRGALLVALSQAGIAVKGYANNVVKKAVSGAGRASKEHVLAMLTRVLGLGSAPETLDASDALALALCHVQRRHHPAVAGRGTGAARGVGGAGAGAPGVPPRLLEAIARARKASPRK